MTERFTQLMNELDQIANSTNSQTKILTFSFAHIGKYIVDSLVEKYEEPYKIFENAGSSALEELIEKFKSVLEKNANKSI